VASELDFRHVSAADGDVDLNSPNVPTAGAADLGLPGRHVRRLGDFNGDPVVTFFGEKRLSG